MGLTNFNHRPRPYTIILGRKSNKPPIARDVEFFLFKNGAQEPGKQQSDVNSGRRAHQQLGGVSVGGNQQNKCTLRSGEALS
jgi:hypothetical protein